MVWRIPAFVLASILLWQAASWFAESRRTAALAGYVHAAWWERGESVGPETLLASPPARPDGRAWSAYAQALVASARNTPDLAVRRQYLERADEAARRALRLSPAQAATWARLALIAVNRGNNSLAAAALSRSLVLAPRASRLAWPRAKVGLYLWEQLDGEGQAAIAADLGRVWRQPPGAELPYPRQAVMRYAASLGVERLVTALIRKEEDGAG